MNATLLLLAVVKKDKDFVLEKNMKRTYCLPLPFDACIVYSYYIELMMMILYKLYMI
jgi:hypothetical protein